MNTAEMTLPSENKSSQCHVCLMWQPLKVHI